MVTPGGGIFGILGNQEIFNMAVVARREMGGGYFWNSRKSQVFNMADVARREVEGGGGLVGYFTGA